MAVSLSTTAIAKVALATTEVQKISLGTTELWSAVVPFTPSGMNKSGTHNLTTAYALVAGWAADTTNYPGSTVSSNRIVAQTAGTGITVEFQLAVSNSSFSQVGTVTLRLYSDGGTLLTQGSSVNVPASSTITTSISATGLTVPASEVFYVHAITNSVAGTRSIQPSNSWGRITKP